MTTKKTKIRSPRHVKLYIGIFHQLRMHGCLINILERGGALETSCGSRFEIVAIEEWDFVNANPTPRRLNNFVHAFISDEAWCHLNTLRRFSSKRAPLEAEKFIKLQVSNNKLLKRLAEDSLIDGYEPR